MTHETVEAMNYDLDLILAERAGITIDELDALPLDEVNRRRYAEQIRQSFSVDT